MIPQGYRLCTFSSLLSGPLSRHAPNSVPNSEVPPNFGCLQVAAAQNNTLTNTVQVLFTPNTFDPDKNGAYGAVPYVYRLEDTDPLQVLLLSSCPKQASY